MFERTLMTPEEVDRDAAEGRSSEEISSLRTGALVLVANVVLTAVLAVATDPRQLPLLQMAITSFIAYYLYKLRPRAENLTLGLAIVGLALAPVLYFTRSSPAVALVETAMSWGTSGALILLLTGTRSRSRRRVALAIFALLTVLPTDVLLILILLHRLRS